MAPMGVPVTTQAPTLIRETGFGDITIQLFKDPQEQLFVRMLRGKPDRKTFCPEHFLQFAKAVETIKLLIQGAE